MLFIVFRIDSAVFVMRTNARESEKVTIAGLNHLGREQ